MIYLQLAILLVCAELWYQGGQPKRAWMRDVLLTIIAGTWIGWRTVWWIGILSIGSFNIVRVGYGIPDATDEGSFLGRLFKKPWLTRGVAGLLYGLVGLLPYVIYTHSVCIYIGYAIANAIVNGMGEALAIHHKVWDRVRGLTIGLLTFIVR